MSPAEDQRLLLHPGYATLAVPKSNINKPHLSQPSHARGTLVILQTDQQFPKFLLGTAISAASLTLARQINQLCDSLPAGATRGGVLSVFEKLLRVFGGLCLLLVDLAVV